MRSPTRRSIPAGPTAAALAVAALAAAVLGATGTALAAPAETPLPICLDVTITDVISTDQLCPGATDAVGA